MAAKQKTEMQNTGIIRLVMQRMDQKKEFAGTDIPLQVKNEFCMDYKKKIQNCCMNVKYVL